MGYKFTLWHSLIFVILAYSSGLNAQGARFCGNIAMEPAGALGREGANLGVGMQFLADDNPPPGQTTVPRLQRVYMNMGVLYGIDAGLQLGMHPSGNFACVGGDVRFNVYEGFALPALALRTSYQQLLSQSNAEYQSYGLGPLLSYGIFPYSEVFLGLDWLMTKERQNPSAAIADVGPIPTSGKQLLVHAGIKLRILPPFTSLVLAYAKYQASKSGGSWQAKVSYGF